MDESDHLTLVNAGDEEVVSQEEGEGVAAEGEGGRCCCASAIAIAHMRAHRARENFEGMYVYYYRTYEKAVSGGGEREKGGHVLRDTTSRGLYVRVWPPHTSERRGGGGGCEQEGWQGGEGRARMSGQEERQRHIRRC